MVKAETPCAASRAITRGFPPQAPRICQDQGSIQEHALFLSGCRLHDGASAHSPHSTLNCSFYESSVSCWLITNQPEQLADYQSASSRGLIGDPTPTAATLPLSDFVSFPLNRAHTYTYIYSLTQDPSNSDMGKLRPAGHIRPVRLFNPARRTCPNRDLVYFRCALARKVLVTQNPSP